jgi:signal transduction histidine kinase
MVLALGAVAEAVAPAASPALTVADFAVGAVAAVAGTARRSRLAVLAGAAWFAGTLLGGLALLAYRGPLLCLLLVPRRREHLLLCVTGLFPGAVTAVLGAAVAVVTRARLAAAGAAAVLAAVWALGALDVTGLALVNDAAVALALVAGLRPRPAGALVVELGDRRPGRPLTERLARALADPGLELRYELPGVGWVDERGRPAPVPDGEAAATRARAPDGGEVVLLHGEPPRDRRLAEAAAAGAVLALDATRLEAEMRARAAEVAESRRRLLAVADEERRALGEELAGGPLARLRGALERLGDGEARTELEAAISELTALGTGLYPPALARADMAGAIAELCRRSPVPASCTVRAAAELPAPVAAALWFAASEALANAARHAEADHITVVLDGATLTVTDDGRGGAVPERGLRGLADRLAALGGTLEVDSPPGGPTTIRARLPLE